MYGMRRWIPLSNYFCFAAQFLLSTGGVRHRPGKRDKFGEKDPLLFFSLQFRHFLPLLLPSSVLQMMLRRAEERKTSEFTFSQGC